MAKSLSETITAWKQGMGDRLLLRLLSHGLRRQWKNYAVGIAAMFVVAAAASGTAWSMQAIVDTMGHAQSRSEATRVALIIIAIFTTRGIATYIQSVFMARAGNGIIAEQQMRLYEKLMRQGVEFFNLRESSDLLMRVTQSAQMARSAIDLIVTSMVRDLLTVVGLIAVMVYQQPVLSVVSLVVLPLAVLGVRLILTQVRAIMQKEMSSLAAIIKVVQETAGGIRIIKVFSLEKVMEARMQKAVDDVAKRSNAIARLEAVTAPLMETLAGFAIAGVVWISAVNIFGGTATTPGQLMSFVTALLMAYEPASRLSRMRVSVEASMVGVRMMYDLLDQEETIIEKPGARALPPGPGVIAMEDVSFSYDGTRPVLDHVEMEFPAGQTTALVGESGAGKSTVLNMVMRLYDPTTGRVTVDGHDISEATFASLRARMSYVGQDTFLFAASVIENIRCSRPESTDDEVMAACQAAHAHDFIMALPKGYQTQVGENGAFLSGGQRQRLAIARAFLRRAQVLLLDEATSALDAASEDGVKTGLAEVSKGATTVVIAHRLSTILRADRIYVMGEGRVLETGTAAELLQKGGAFKALYDRQFADTKVD